jgi:inner membrane protein
MTGKTHLIIGASAGAAMALATSSAPAPGLLMILAAAIGALLPDIDSPNSMVSRRIRPARLLFMWFSHRTITHSVFAMLALITAAYVLVLNDARLWIVAYPIVAGYASHIGADMATVDGIPLFYPFWSRSLHVLPPFFRVMTGGLVESVFYVLSCGALVYLIALFLKVV